MLKYLLSLFSIFVLLLSSVFVPTRTAACPIRLPETLLSLYKNSDTIYVGRFDKVEDAEIIENTDERTVVNIRTHFDISSTLKGESRKFLILDSEDYRYKPIRGRAAEESAEPEESGGEEVEWADMPFGAGTLKSGDVVLLFLKHGDEGKPIQLTDFRDGIKRMTPQRIESYEARIRELNSIFASKKVDDAAIVEWLVRCTQDPATRWEGAYQFQRSFQQLAWIKEQEQEAKEAGAEENGAEDSDAVEESDSPEATEQESVDGPAADENQSESESSEEADEDLSIYARLLSDSQKEALMRILTDKMPTSEEKGQKLSVGDKVLIDVVSNWGDRRFARFLLDRLQGFSGEPYEVSEQMSTIAKVLADDDLSKIAERYSNVYYEEDDAVVESGEVEDKPEAEEALIEEKGEESSEPADKTEPDSEETRVTYKQLRADLFKTFIDRSLVILASEAENEKVNR